jgi:dihydrodipicolinate synthase/N-acetylneuraminate lyase
MEHHKLASATKHSCTRSDGLFLHRTVELVASCLCREGAAGFTPSTLCFAAHKAVVILAEFKNDRSFLKIVISDRWSPVMRTVLLPVGPSM